MEERRERESIEGGRRRKMSVKGNYNKTVLHKIIYKQTITLNQTKHNKRQEIDSDSPVKKIYIKILYFMYLLVL